jgi:hypothetical protein
MSTAAEWVDSVKRDLAKGQSYGLTNSIIYHYLNRSKRQVELRTMCTFRANVPIKTTLGTGTYDLSDSSVIELSNSLCKTAIVLEAYYKMIASPLPQVDLAKIARLRLVSNYSAYPDMYSQVLVSGNLQMDLYPSPNVTIDDFDDAYLYVDMKESTPDISSTQDPLTPDMPEIDDAIVAGAVWNIAQNFRDIRTAGFRELYILKLSELRVLTGQASGGGKAIAGIAL